MALDGGQIRLIDIPGVRELTNVVHQPLQQSDVKFPDQDRSDASMLKEAVGNRMLAEGFMASRGLAASWDFTGIVLRAFVEPVKWQGSNQYRSSLGIPLLAENFYSSLSVFQQQLFASYEPFKVEPTVNSTMEVAQAQQALIEAQLKTAAPRGSSAKQEIRSIAYDCLLLGTGVGIMCWEQRTIKKRKLRLKNASKSIPLNAEGTTATVHPGDDDYEEYVDSYTTNHPVLEHVPLRRVRVSPDCRRGNIRTARWAGRIMYLSAYDLDSFRDCDGFKIPTREEFIKLTTPQKDQAGQNVLDTQTGSTNVIMQRIPAAPQQAYPEWMSTSSTLDPLAQPFEVFEYWTGDRVCWILENQAVIRNDTHDTGQIPMLSFVFRDAPDSFFGYGMGMWLTDFQRICQGIVNYFFDDLNLNLAGTYTSEQGMNNSAQAAWISPGKVFKTTGPEGLKPMTRNSTQNDPLAIVEQVKSWGASISGAGAGVQGVNPGKPGDMRTGIGVQTLTQGEGMKMQDLIDQFCDLVLIPFLEFCIANNKRLKPSQLRQMLNDTLEKAQQMDPIDLINADYKVTIAAGTRLQARTALNQSLGYIQSVLQQPGLSDQLAVQGVKIDYKALFDALFMSTGFPYEAQIIAPMNDDDKMRLQQQQGTMNKAAMELAKIQAQAAAKKDVDNNQAENRMLLKVGERGLDHASPEAAGLDYAEKKGFERVDQGQPMGLG